jgi:F-type H+-transporting ATPase subunit b
MDKLINDFSFGLFIWQIVIFVGLIFIKKFAWKPILDALMIEKKELKHYFLLKMLEMKCKIFK